MLYQKILKVSLSLYAFLSSPIHGSIYYVSSASSADYQCPSDTTNCHIYCDKEDIKSNNVYNCNNAQNCYFYCDEKKCGQNAEINAANANILNITQTTAAEQCLASATITAPNDGSAYLSTHSKKGFQWMNVYAGSNTNEIIIDATWGKNDEKHKEYEGIDVYAATADYLRINIGSDLEWISGTIECPVDSSYHGPDIAPCMIDATNGKIKDTTINAPDGVPKNVYIEGCADCNNVDLSCDRVDLLNGAQSGASTYPFSTASHCWWTRDPTSNPTIDPTFDPTIVPTFDPTMEPTQPTSGPTFDPTIVPTFDPTMEPTQPTYAPTFSPTQTPTQAPSLAPSDTPSLAPTQPPSLAPSLAPTQAPSLSPTQPPSLAPSLAPTQAPSFAPTKTPSTAPTTAPTRSPSNAPSEFPTQTPSNAPTLSPTIAPTAPPTKSPTIAPTDGPTTAPTSRPTPKTVPPTYSPTIAPSSTPTFPTKAPTNAPTTAPTALPTQPPTNAPTQSPTIAPTTPPTQSPTNAPSTSPTFSPTVPPTQSPTIAPTTAPTTSPTAAPTQSPTIAPTAGPTTAPTSRPTPKTVPPTNAPGQRPTFSPTVAPTLFPSNVSTIAPSMAPTNEPTVAPTNVPSNPPTLSPTHAPTVSPTNHPTMAPSIPPTNQPTVATNSPSNPPTLPPTTPVETTADSANNIFSALALVDVGITAMLILGLIIIGVCCVICVIITWRYQDFKEMIQRKVSRSPPDAGHAAIVQLGSYHRDQNNIRNPYPERSESEQGIIEYESVNHDHVSVTPDNMPQPPGGLPPPPPSQPGAYNDYAMARLSSATEALWDPGPNEDNDERTSGIASGELGAGQRQVSAVSGVPGISTIVNMALGDYDEKAEQEKVFELQKMRSWVEKTVRLKQYIPVLIMNGYDNLDSLKELTMQDLETMGIFKVGHRRKLLKYARRL